MIYIYIYHHCKEKENEFELLISSNIYNSITGFGLPGANLYILQIIQKTDLKIVYCLYVG